MDVSPQAEHPLLVGLVLVLVEAQLQILGAFRLLGRAGLTFQSLIAAAFPARMRFTAMPNCGRFRLRPR